MEPINYILDVKNPIDEYMKGLKFARTDLADQQAMQINQQNMSMAQQQFADQQSALQAQRAAADKAVADAQAGQAELARLAGLGAAATAEDYMKAWVANPAIRDDLNNLKTMITEPQSAALLQTTQNMYATTASGNVEATRNILQTNLDAALNSGDQTMVPAYRAALDQLDQNPEGAMAQLKTTSAMTLMGLKGPEYIKTINESLGLTPAKTPEGFQTLGLRAEAAGFKPGTPEYQKFMATGGDKGPLVQIGDQETSFAKAAGEKAAATFSGLIDQGVSASRSLAQLDNLETLLSGVETGLGAQFKSFLGQYGIDTAGLSAQREAGSGTMTDRDVNLFKSSLPSLINQPGGNKLIIDTIRGINEYDVAASLIAGKVMDGVLTREEGRKALMEIPNPLAGFKAPKTTETTAAPAPTDAKAAFLADPRIKALDPAQQETAWTKYQEIMAGQ
jgi:sRNA-binding protein